MTEVAKNQLKQELGLKLETSRDYEKASKLLKEEAKKLKTPEEIEEGKSSKLMVKEMRLGKHMKEILQVLNETKEPMTLTQIIAKIQNKEIPKENYCQKLASALSDEIVRFDSPIECYLINKKGKRYHPIDCANYLYALYSRNIRLLLENGYILSNAQHKGNKRLSQINVKKTILNV